MENIFGLLTFVLIGTFSPGPNNIVSMSNAMQDGLRNIKKFLLGLGTGFTIMMILSSSINRLLFTRYPSLIQYMKYLGVIYLLYLAYKIFRSTFKELENTNNNFKTGFLMQLVNIKVILYGVVIFSSFIDPTSINILSLVGTSILLALVAVTSCITWGYFGELFKSVLGKHQKLLNTILSISLVIVAISIL